MALRATEHKRNRGGEGHVVRGRTAVGEEEEEKEEEPEEVAWGERLLDRKRES